MRIAQKAELNFVVVDHTTPQPQSQRICARRPEEQERPLLRNLAIPSRRKEGLTHHPPSFWRASTAEPSRAPNRELRTAAAPLAAALPKCKNKEQSMSGVSQVHRNRKKRQARA
jgi:hypothetical protein